jgi:arsenate reductase
MAIVIYQKPTCTTCRQVYAALKDSGVDVAAVDYYLEPISKSKLLELLRKMRITPRELLRTKKRFTQRYVSPSATSRTMRSSI